MESKLARLQPTWSTIRGMRVPHAFSTNTAEELVRQTLGLCDVSCFSRFGVKGPNASEWLAHQGLTPPAGVNRWEPMEGNGILARLGTSEFFLEDGLHGDIIERLRSALGRGLPGVYPVIRQDAAISVSGNEVTSLLAQTCNINFTDLDISERVVVMTSMVGVSVLVIKTMIASGPLYRIWCDGTFGPYLWTTLLQVSEELGGGAIGIDTLFQEVVN